MNYLNLNIKISLTILIFPVKHFSVSLGSWQWALGPGQKGEKSVFFAICKNRN